MPKTEPLYTVRFPPHVNVAAPRKRTPGMPTQTTGGQNRTGQDEETVLHDVTLAKAMKFNTHSDATVTDSDGKVIARGEVVVTDRREPAAAERYEKAEAEAADLRERLGRLEAWVADMSGPEKAKPGPKPGARKST